MPLTDTVWIDTSLSPQETLTLFLEGIGYHDVSQEHKTQGHSHWYHAEVPEFIVRSKTVTKGSRSDTLRISPSIQVRVHPNLEVDWDQPKNALIRATLVFIQRTGADVALELMDAEVIILIHKAGHLIIDETAAIWSPERLAMIPMTYEISKLQDDQSEVTGLWNWLRNVFHLHHD